MKLQDAFVRLENAEPKNFVLNYARKSGIPVCETYQADYEMKYVVAAWSAVNNRIVGYSRPAYAPGKEVSVSEYMKLIDEYKSYISVDLSEVSLSYDEFLIQPVANPGYSQYLFTKNKDMLLGVAKVYAPHGLEGKCIFLSDRFNWQFRKEGGRHILIPTKNPD